MSSFFCNFLIFSSLEWFLAGNDSDEEVMALNPYLHFYRHPDGRISSQVNFYDGKPVYSQMSASQKYEDCQLITKTRKTQY